MCKKEDAERHPLFLRGEGDGGCGLPRARSALAMTGVFVRGAVRRADVGSGLSAASGRGSEVSEWPRSKRPASAVRQRRNFGHRNRIIGPYEMVCRGGRLCLPGMAHNIFVGQGPCALPGVRYKAGRRGEGTPPYGGTRSTAKRGVEDAAPYGWGTRATVRIAPTERL